MLIKNKHCKNCKQSVYTSLRVKVVIKLKMRKIMKLSLCVITNLVIVPSNKLINGNNVVYPRWDMYLCAIVLVYLISRFIGN